MDQQKNSVITSRQAATGRTTHPRPILRWHTAALDVGAIDDLRLGGAVTAQLGKHDPRLVAGGLGMDGVLHHLVLPCNELSVTDSCCET